MATPQIVAIGNEIRRRKGPIASAGIDDCRPFRINGKLRPDLGWSQHAWGNAEDLKVNGYAAQKPIVDELKKMGREGYPVGTILWAGNRPKDHGDHIHVEGSPKKTGTPPCAGGDKGYDLPEDVPRESDKNPFTDPGGWLKDQVEIAFGTDPLTGQLGIGGRIAFGLLALTVVVLTVYLLTKGFVTDQAGKIVKAVT